MHAKALNLTKKGVSTMIAFARVIGSSVDELAKYYGYDLVVESKGTKYDVYLKDDNGVELVDEYTFEGTSEQFLNTTLVRRDLMQTLRAKNGSKQVGLYQDKSLEMKFIDTIAYCIEELTRYFECELSIIKNTLVTEEIHDVYLNFGNDVVYVATVYGELDSIMRDSKLGYDIMKVIERHKNVKLVQL